MLDIIEENLRDARSKKTEFASDQGQVLPQHELQQIASLYSACVDKVTNKNSTGFTNLGTCKDKLYSDSSAWSYTSTTRFSSATVHRSGSIR